MRTFWPADGRDSPAYLAAGDRESALWCANFIDTYLERDLLQLGPRIPAETLRRFWTMLAHAQGSLLNAAEFARSLGVDGKTVARYIDLLVDLLLVRRRWAVEIKRGMVPSPGRGFSTALEDTKPDRAFIVYGGTERYSKGEGIGGRLTVTSAASCVQTRRFGRTRSLFTRCFTVERRISAQRRFTLTNVFILTKLSQNEADQHA